MENYSFFIAPMGVASFLEKQQVPKPGGFVKR